MNTVLQLLLLYWLTICTPFVFTAQQKLNQINATASLEDSNPQSSTQEEKGSGIVGFNEEFLHDHHNFIGTLLQTKRVSILHQNTYSAYHGEPLCPPPNLV